MIIHKQLRARLWHDRVPRFEGEIIIPYLHNCRDIKHINYPRLAPSKHYGSVRKSGEGILLHPDWLKSLLKLVLNTIQGLQLPV